MIKFSRTNIPLLSFISIAILYVIYNERKDFEPNKIIKIKANILNTDSILSELEQKNRLAIDSLINENKKAEDSLYLRLSARTKTKKRQRKQIQILSDSIGVLPNF